MAVGLALLLAGLVACNRAPSTSSPPPPSPAIQPVTGTAAATTTPAPPDAAPAPASADEPLRRARELSQDGRLAEARAQLQPLAEQPAAPDPVLDLLGKIDTEILFTPAPAPEKIDYTAVAGDSLGKIAKKFGTTVELIKKSNNLSRDLIRVGDRLRIYQGQFAVLVSKTTNVLTLSDHGKFFKRYRVGTGEYRKTPVGDFKIINRVANPPWWRADGQQIPFGDPGNILGTHWLGLDVPGYGLHGTWDTNSIGKRATAGCIRLRNDDIAELYTILPVGTVVSIRE